MNEIQNKDNSLDKAQNNYDWANFSLLIFSHNVILDILHHGKHVDLFWPNDCCQFLIRNDVFSVLRVLEVVLFDVSPDEAHNLPPVCSLNMNDVLKVLIHLKLSSHILETTVSSVVGPFHHCFESCSSDSSIFGLDQMVFVVPKSSKSSWSVHFELNFGALLNTSDQFCCFREAYRFPKSNTE